MNGNEFKCIQWESLKEVKMVGSGSFGNIYKARHDQWEMLVAVKELKGDVYQELLSEAKKMHSASSGPNLITLFGIMKNTTGERQGIVMEYMALGSLHSQLIHFTKDAWPLKFRILHEVAMGMNWLHNLPTPLLHLDLKPKNVLLDEDLHVKISDFGLSKFTQGSSNCVGELGGTLEYMPPEAFQKGYQAHQSFDVYSFGILSYVVLTGNEPYPGAITRLIPLHIPQGGRPLIDSLEKEASVVKFIDQAVQFTKQCWHNEKEQRPSFKECCKAWEEYYSAHKIDIIKAVGSLQEKICKGAVPGPPSTISVASSNMTDVIKTMEMKLKITEEPSAKLYAAPVMGNLVNSQKTSHSPASQNHQHQIPQQNRTQTAVLDTGYHTQTPWTGISTIHQQQNNSAGAGYLQQVYKPPPPSNSLYPWPRESMRFQRSSYTPMLRNPQQQMTQQHRPQTQRIYHGNSTQFPQTDWRMQNGLQPGYQWPEFQPNPWPFSINIYGKTDGMQIGHNNVMNITTATPKTRQSSTRSKTLTQQRSNPTTMAERPPHTPNTQGSMQAETGPSQDDRRSQTALADHHHHSPSSQNNATAPNKSSMIQIYPPTNPD